MTAWFLSGPPKFVPDYKKWGPYFNAVGKGDLNYFRQVLARHTEKEVTTDMMQKLEDGTPGTLLACAAKDATTKDILRFLLESYCWGFEKTQAAFGVALGVEESLDVFVSAKQRIAPRTLLRSVFHRKIFTTYFNRDYSPHQDAHTAIDKLIAHGAAVPQDLLHVAVLGDDGRVVRQLLQTHAVSLTDKTMWLLGYNSVELGSHTINQASAPPNVGSPVVLPLENLRAFPPIQTALEKETGSLLLPEWVEKRVAEGQECKRRLILELQTATSEDIANRIRVFEETLLVSPDDNCDELAPMARDLADWEIFVPEKAG